MQPDANPPTMTSPSASPPQPTLPSQPAPMSPLSTPSQSKLPLIIAAVVAGLLVAGALVWFLLVFQPAQQIKSAANSFVKTAVAGDHEDALELTDVDDGEEEAALGLIESLDDQLGDSSYKIDKIESNGDAKRVKYVVDGDDDKRFVVSVQKVDGKWKVVEIILNIGASTESKSDTESDVAQAPATTPTACLPAAALDKFWRYKSGWQFYFKADTNELQDYGNGQLVAGSVASTSVTEMLEFYNDNKQYQFVFKIDVGLYQSTDQTLAQKRAGVVAYNMNLRGIPYEYMRLGEIISGGDPSRPDLAGGSRNATVEINSECDALNQQQNLDVEGSKSRGQAGA